MKRYFVLILIFMICVINFSVYSSISVISGHQNLLILNSYHYTHPWAYNVQKGIIDHLFEKFPFVRPRVEYLDTKYVQSPDHLFKIKELIKYKYRADKISIVITIDDSAFEFAINHQRELFPQAKIIFCGVNNLDVEKIRNQNNITGVAEVIDPRGTVESILKLLPATKNIFVIYDYSSTGIGSKNELLKVLHIYKNRIYFEYVENTTQNRIIQKIRDLPSGYVVLLLSFGNLFVGSPINLFRFSDFIKNECRLPVFAVHEPWLNRGIVGGSLLSGKYHGIYTAKVVERIINGEKISNIPVCIKSTAKLMFDYKMLVKHKIPFTSIPGDAIIINEEYSIFKAYSYQIISTIVFIFLLIVLI